MMSPSRGKVCLLILSLSVLSRPLVAREDDTGKSSSTGTPPVQQPSEKADEAARAPEDATTRHEILRQRRKEKKTELSPYEVTTWEKRIRTWEEAQFPINWLVKGWKGVRPVFGGMPSGSGFVGGVGYIHGLDAEYFQAQANARYSTRGYTMLDAEAVFPPPQAGRRFEFKGVARYRDLTSLRFFGLGNESRVDEQSTYLLQDTLLSGYAWLNPRGLLSFGAQGAFLGAEADSGSDDRSLEEIFDPDDVPGFDSETDYSVVSAWVEFDVRNKWEEPNVGVVARVTAERYDDMDANAFDFTRVIGDVKAYVPLGPKSRILALRFRTSHSSADAGDRVPFYLMETLGGAKTIRGFREWRFRDTRNLLLSVEYRWEVWTYADFTFFWDGGKVFSDEDDFNFDDLQSGYGFGIRGHAPAGVTLRFDFARSTEGFKFHISGGPEF